MTWVVVLLIATVVAEQAGPDVAAVYITALGVAAIALAFIIVPGWTPPDRTDRGRRGRNEKRAR